MERLVEAEKFNVKLKAKEEDEKFKFSKPGCEKQFKFNIKMKDRFGVDLKMELERCFEKELPAGVKRLVEEVEKEIDGQNVKLKVADEFGLEAMEDFNKEDLARKRRRSRSSGRRRGTGNKGLSRMARQGGSGSSGMTTTGATAAGSSGTSQGTASCGTPGGASGEAGDRSSKELLHRY